MHSRPWKTLDKIKPGSASSPPEFILPNVGVAAKPEEKQPKDRQKTGSLINMTVQGQCASSCLKFSREMSNTLKGQ